MHFKIRKELVYYKRQEPFTLREHLGSPPLLGADRVAHRFSFLCCVVGLFFVFCLRIVSCVSSFSFQLLRRY